MDHSHAALKGAEGEQRVSRELARLREAYGFQHLDNLLLRHGRHTAQLDHVLVDRYGVLVLETKVRSGAGIRGMDVESRWTACYSGKNCSFQNPIAQNRHHEQVLREVLKNHGQPLQPDYVKSAVVFVGADISRLDLDAIHRARVVTVDQLEELLRQRHEFALNRGDVVAGRVEDLIAALKAVDCSGNPAVVMQHEESVNKAAGARPRDRLGAATPAHRPTPTTYTTRRGAVPSPPLREAGRPKRGSVVPGIVALLLVSVCGLGPAAGLLASAFYSGPGIVSAPPPASRQEAAAEIPTRVSQRPSVPLSTALTALREASPEKYSKLANTYSPRVSVDGGLTTYTWEYVQQAGKDAARVRTISLVFDASGRVVGAK